MKKLYIFLIFGLILGLNSNAAAINSCDYNCNSCSSCQADINSASAGETVCLTQDISTAVDCITWTNNRITLDCDGYKLSGDGGTGDYGIWLNGDACDNNTIKNCKIENFGRGVYINLGDDNHHFSQVFIISIINTIITPVDFFESGEPFGNFRMDGGIGKNKNPIFNLLPFPHIASLPLASQFRGTQKAIYSAPRPFHRLPDLLTLHD